MATWLTIALVLRFVRVVEREILEEEAHGAPENQRNANVSGDAAVKEPLWEAEDVLVLRRVVPEAVRGDVPPCKEEQIESDDDDSLASRRAHKVL